MAEENTKKKFYEDKTKTKLQEALDRNAELIDYLKKHPWSRVTEFQGKLPRERAFNVIEDLVEGGLAEYKYIAVGNLAEKRYKLVDDFENKVNEACEKAKYAELQALYEKSKEVLGYLRERPWSTNTDVVLAKVSPDVKSEIDSLVLLGELEDRGLVVSRRSVVRLEENQVLAFKEYKLADDIDAKVHEIWEPFVKSVTKQVMDRISLEPRKD